MADHSKFVALAVRLVDKEGRTITLQKLSATGDVTKPWQGAGTPTVAASATAKAVFLPASGNGMGNLGVRKELIQRVEQVALVAPNAVDLTTMTVITDGAVKYKIDWIETLKPADEVCLYVIGVCR